MNKVEKYLLIKKPTYYYFRKLKHVYLILEEPHSIMGV